MEAPTAARLLSAVVSLSQTPNSLKLLLYFVIDTDLVTFMDPSENIFVTLSNLMQSISNIETEI